MEFSPTERDILRPFAYGSSFPPRAVYTRALTLVGNRSIRKTFVERLESEHSVRLNVWILLDHALALVAGEGPRGWDQPRGDPPTTLTADLWPVAAIATISIETIEEYGGDFGGEITWSPVIRVELPDRELILPALGFPEMHPVREQLDQFIEAVISAFGLRPARP